MSVPAVNQDAIICVVDTTGNDGKTIIDQEFDITAVRAEIKDITKRSAKVHGTAKEVMLLLGMWADRLQQLSDQIETEKTAKEAERGEKSSKRLTKQKSRSRSTDRTRKIFVLTQEISRLGNTIRDLNDLDRDCQKIRTLIVASFNSLSVQLKKAK